jgi:hypothetical protein
LPAEASEIRFGGKRVPIAAGLDRKAGVGAVTAIREGNAAVAIRVFTSGVQLKADAIGLKYRAARLVVYHPERGPHVRVGMLILAAPCADEAALAALIRRAQDARIEDAADAHQWRVTASVQGLKLVAARDLDRRLPLERSVNGQRWETAPLVVNGRAVSMRSLM